MAFCQRLTDFARKPYVAQTEGMMNEQAWITPTMIADDMGVDVAKVIGWIRSHQLTAVNVAASPTGRKPRWRIRREEFEAFLKRRQSGEPTVAPRRKIIPPPENVLKFY